jgi:hypothetical protein
MTWNEMKEGSIRVHLHHPSSNVYLSLHPDVFKGLRTETVFTQGLAAASDGAV